MKLEVIQFSIHSLYSVYIVRDYLNNDELYKLDQVLRDKTKVDVMNKSTNVKANMTSYTALQEVPECLDLMNKTIYTIDSIVKLRGCVGKDSFIYRVTDAWGMRHNKDDYSINHAHYPSHWAAAFYTSVPEPKPYMKFTEFDKDLQLDENTLIVFPAMINHEVTANKSNDERISMAFNIDVEKQ